MTQGHPPGLGFRIVAGRRGDHLHSPLPQRLGTARVFQEGRLGSANELSLLFPGHSRGWGAGEREKRGVTGWPLQVSVIKASGN